MARFAEAVALAVGLLCPAATPAAPPVTQYADVLNAPATDEGIAAAYRELGGPGCTDVDCLALGDVIAAFELMGYRDRPNGDTLLDPSSFRRGPFNVKLEKLLRSHRDRWPRYCIVLQKLARHYQDQLLGLHVAELSGRISSPSLDCAAAVMPLFPDTADSRFTIEAALEGCQLADHPGCPAIIRAISARRARLHQH